jgi:hypothetical protein
VHDSLVIAVAAHRADVPGTVVPATSVDQGTQILVPSLHTSRRPPRKNDHEVQTSISTPEPRRDISERVDILPRLRGQFATRFTLSHGGIIAKFIRFGLSACLSAT